MSNPYTAPTLTGYNASDTQDSQVTTYEWALHKTEIGDPIKTYLDDIKSAISTGFGKTLFASVTVKTDDYTILESDRGALLVMTGVDKTFTLPAADTVGPNFVVTILNQVVDTASSGSSEVTIANPTSQTINDESSLKLYNFNEWGILHTDGSQWYLINDKPGPQTKVTTTSFAHTDPLSTNLVAIPELSGFTFRENRRYLVEGYLICTTGGVAPHWYFFDTGTGAADDPDFGQMLSDGSGNSAIRCSRDTNLDPNITYAGNVISVFTMLGRTTGADATDGALQFRNEFADSSPPTIQKGSYVRVTELNQGYD